YDSIKAIAAGASNRSQTTPRRGPAAVRGSVPSGRARDTHLTAPSGSHNLDVTTIDIPSAGVDILVDHREPQSIVDLLRSCPNVRVEVTSLPVGDFVIGPIIVERKTVSDFEQSVMNGRLFDEA